jgi:hypothetical protein
MGSWPASQAQLHPLTAALPPIADVKRIKTENGYAAVKQEQAAWEHEGEPLWEDVKADPQQQQQQQPAAAGGGVAAVDDAAEEDDWEDI